MPTPYEWRPIADLPTDFEHASSGELDSLLQVWKEQREEMERAGVVQKFNERLRRRWAIETGIVENVYFLDRGTTELLVAHGIDSTLIPDDSGGKDPVTIASMVQDHLDVLEGLFAFINSERQLSTSYIRELHAAFFRHERTTPARDQFGNAVYIDVTPGEYKNFPNNPHREEGARHEYCPPEHVASEMDRLVELHLDHERRGIAAEIEAAWLHHRFTQIHPFTDGNGRVARTLASLLFLRKGWFPLVIAREDKPAYIDAHCCPVKSQTESVGCSFRVNRLGTLMPEVPVKWAFSRKARC